MTEKRPKPTAENPTAEQSAEIERLTEEAATGDSSEVTPIDSLDAPSAPLGLVAGDSGTTNALARLMERTPFIDLHLKAGDCAEHKIRGRVCFAVDFAFRMVTLSLIIAIIAVVAYKTLAPFPHWH